MGGGLYCVVRHIPGFIIVEEVLSEMGTPAPSSGRDSRKERIKILQQDTITMGFYKHLFGNNPC